MTASPLLTAREAGAYLRCSRSFLTEHSSELGGRRIGSRLMFVQADLDAYIDRSKIAGPVQHDVAVAQVKTARSRTLTLVGRGAVNPVDGLPWDATPAARRAERGR